MAKDKKYLAISEEHLCMFWKQGDYGYTFNRFHAKRFSFEEVINNQKQDPVSKWAFIESKDDLDLIDFKRSRIWVMVSDDQYMHTILDALVKRYSL
jgi:hypothetical protein